LTARPSTTFKLSLVFLFLVGINVYVFFFSKGSLRSVSRAAQTASLPAPRPAVVPVEPQWTARDGSVRAGEGLGSALRRDGLPAAEVDRLLRALRPLVDFKREIVVGQRYRVAATPAGRIVAFELRAGGVAYAVSRAPDGTFLAGKGRPRGKK
jgi:hypothetical protein